MDAKMVKQFFFRNVWWMTLVLSLCLLIIHTTAFRGLKVDTTSVVLLLIVFLSPFASAIRKIKFGEFEAEIDPKEVQSVKDEVSGLEQPPTPEERPPEIYSAITGIRELAVSDPTIALAKLRIELEKVILKVYRLTHPGADQRRTHSLGQTIHQLLREEVLAGAVAGSVREVIAICNRAVHGENIRQQDAESMVEVGTSLLERLYWQARELGLSPIEHAIVEPSEVEKYERMRYRLTTLVPLVDKPVKNVRILDQEGLDEFLEGYHEFAEFIVSLEPLED